MPATLPPSWTSDLKRLALPPALRPWLSQRGSLTACLRALAQEGVAVVVRGERYGRPTRAEAVRLGLVNGQRTWLREVTLLVDGEPWVSARTVVPLASLRGAGRRLRHLGRQPLGERLFRPWAPRSGFEYAAGDGDIRWWRRSILHPATGPLLVAEGFHARALHAFHDAGRPPCRRQG